jgi:transcriptional regulator with XRE-family HTH domain
MDANNTNRSRSTLGRTLRELRDRAGLTQKELAGSSGTDDTYISRVEHGRIDVGWSTLQRLLAALGTDMHQLADALVEAEQQDPPPKR